MVVKAGCHHVFNGLFQLRGERNFHTLKVRTLTMIVNFGNLLRVSQVSRQSCSAWDVLWSNTSETLDPIGLQDGRHCRYFGLRSPCPAVRTPRGMKISVYSANFSDFLDAAPKDKPWCFTTDSRRAKRFIPAGSARPTWRLSPPETISSIIGQVRLGSRRLWLLSKKTRGHSMHPFEYP